MILMMIIFLFSGLLLGIPVAFQLAFTGLFFSLLGVRLNYFDGVILQALPNRLFGIIDNQLLFSVPLFIFMGNILEKTCIAEKLLSVLGSCLTHIRGGLALSVIFVGALLAASTGIVGATVITLSLIALPSMLKQGYSQQLATGTIASVGTLGQLLPPSIALILLADVLSNAYQQAQLSQGKFFLETVSIAELFQAAIIPGLMLTTFYGLYVLWAAKKQSTLLNKQQPKPSLKNICTALLPPIILIIAVLGSILKGIATPTEAAAVGCFGALMIALWQKQLSFNQLQQILDHTLFITCMVFMILIGASIFSLSFRAFGGDHTVEHLLMQLPGGVYSQLFCVMLLIFCLGFILDFIEIIFIVVPVVAPILFKQDIQPVWFGILLAINLQTSFLTPPFGFALFYLKGAAGNTVQTQQLYRGILPFIIIQLITLTLIACFPCCLTGK